MELTNFRIDDLAQAVLQALPRLSPEEQRISLQIYRLLAEGSPVAVERLVTTVAVPRKAVDAHLERLRGLTYYDDQGRIQGYGGLALPKMTHRFKVNGRTLYTWCAWDSLFIPQLIGRTADVESPCPVTGRTVRLQATPLGPRHAEPAEAALSFLRPSALSIMENAIASFCHYVHFFSSADAAERWVAHHEGTFVLSLEEAAYLAHKKNEAQYAHAL